MAATRRQASRAASAAAAPPRGWRPALALLVLALGSSFSVVYATHECRQLYARLQDIVPALTRAIHGESGET